MKNVPSQSADRVVFLPGNHLYPAELLEPYTDSPIVMVEDIAVCSARPYHQQKLALVLGAMREHAAVLRDHGFDVRYFHLSDNMNIPSALASVVEAVSAGELTTFEVVDQRLEHRLRSFCNHHKLTWSNIQSPAFLTTAAAFRDFAGDKQQLKMADFYKLQRSKLNLLLQEDGKPLGGRWSFDEDNRKKLPRKQATPELPMPHHSATTRAAMEDVVEHFADHPGDARQLWLPTERVGAQIWLQQFLQERLVGFGTYEDAITTRSATLFHSTLSPLLNLGLLTPKEVVAATEDFAANHQVALNDLEGFIRQVIGWREFIRGVYDRHGSVMRRSNSRGSERLLTHHWHDGTTGIAPLDLAIQHQMDLGWNHHINRLMVIANLMNLCEIHPREVYEYFMTYYVDAYDWVMVPNVYGMGLNCDGGIFATKPYICGSNYLLKMSDIPRGEWCDVVDGLYWRFVANNLNELRRNPRLAAFTSGLNRMADEKRQRIFSAAEAFLDRCTTSPN